MRNSKWFIIVGGTVLTILVTYLVYNTPHKPSQAMIQSIQIVERGSYVPSYRSLEVRGDATASYESGAYAPKKIEENITGKIDEAELERIVNLLYEKGFFSMNGKHYNNPEILDASTTKTTVRTDKKEYTASEYGGGGPKKLQEINQELWSLKDEIKKTEK